MNKELLFGMSLILLQSGVSFAGGNTKLSSNQQVLARVMTNEQEHEQLVNETLRELDEQEKRAQAAEILFLELEKEKQETLVQLFESQKKLNILDLQQKACKSAYVKSIEQQKIMSDALTALNIHGQYNQN